MTAFVICALLGGILVLFGMLGHDHSPDMHAELHLEGDADADGFNFNWLPFLSIRFWSYGLVTFGLVGLVLTFVVKMSPVGVMAIALLSGFSCGCAVVFAIRALGRNMVSTGATVNDLTGAVGKVTVAVRGLTPGRIRCELKGEILDLVAVTEEGQTIEVGTPVIVTAIENDRALVMPQAAFYSQDPVSARNQ